MSLWSKKNVFNKALLSLRSAARPTLYLCAATDVSFGYYNDSSIDGLCSNNDGYLARGEEIRRFGCLLLLHIFEMTCNHSALYIELG